MLAIIFILKYFVPLIRTQYCQWYCSFWPFEVLYDYHRFNFLNRLVVAECIKSKSELDHPDYMLIYVNLKCKYGILASDSIAKIRYCFWKHFEDLLQ